MVAYLSTDVIPNIARHLRDSDALRTLSTLLVLDKEHYPIIATILHRSMVFYTDESLTTFLTRNDPTQLLTSDSASSATSSRRKDNLLRVKEVRLDSPPSNTSASLILSYAKQMPLHHLFPHCHTISIHSNAIKQLPTRAPSTSYNSRSSASKVYEAIRRLARPTHFRIVRPSKGGCTAYREMHTYFITHKADKRLFFQDLKGPWPELGRVDWGEIHTDDALAVFGVENVYGIPKCDCAGNETFEKDLYEKILEWPRRGQGKALPRASLVLRGEEDVVQNLKGRMEQRQREMWEPEVIPPEALLKVTLEVVE